MLISDIPITSHRVDITVSINAFELKYIHSQDQTDINDAYIPGEQSRSKIQLSYN